MTGVIAAPYIYAVIVLALGLPNPYGRVRVALCNSVLWVGMWPWFAYLRRAGATNAQVGAFAWLWAVALTLALVWLMAALRGPHTVAPAPPPPHVTNVAQTQTPAPPKPPVHTVRINGRYEARTRHLREHYRRKRP